MLTEERPDDDLLKNNLNLHQFAKMALPERVIETIDRLFVIKEMERLSLSLPPSLCLTHIPVNTNKAVMDYFILEAGCKFWPRELMTH